jgi:hypothetical protein
MDIALLSVILIALVIVCIFSYPDVLNNIGNENKSIEEMNTQELITDFNLLLESEKTQKVQEKENFQSLTNSDYMKEFAKGWDIYTQAPFYFWKSHPKNPVFYEKPLYRKPYRFPFGYDSSYPIPHFNHFEI